MGALLQLAVELVEMNCGQCGGVYAITEKYRAHKALKGEGWHCPYCEASWGYFKSGTLEAKQKELDAEKARTVAALARANQAAASLAAAQKEAKRLAARVANGVCPCCNRTFKWLSSHMKNKHPEYST